MIKFLKNILIIFVIISNLMYMVGLNIYHHICHSNNSFTSSIFIKSKCDHKHNKIQENPKEDNSDLPPCCKPDIKEESSSSCADLEESSCCENTSEYISIDDQYTTSNNEIKIINNYIIDNNLNLSNYKFELISSKIVSYPFFNNENLINLPQRFNITFIHFSTLPVA